MSGSFFIMYYKRSEKVIFRDFGNFGYLSDNRNFGYYSTHNIPNLGDQIISKEGSLFFSLLNYYPEPIDVIVQRIMALFDEVSPEQIKRDAQEFYDNLSCDGFVCKGKTMSECNAQDRPFSYLKSFGNRKISGSIEVENRESENYEQYFGSHPFLSSVQINVSSRCNEHCVHCYIPQKDKTSVMSSTMFYNIIEQCREMHVLNITISGGEPTLNPKLNSFIRKCKEYNFSVNLLSNLTLLNDSLLEEIKSYPLLCVQTSLYSMDPTIHDSITGVLGSFENTKQGILKLWKNDVPMQVNCPIMKQNKDSYKQVLDWAHSLSIEADSDFYLFGDYYHSCENLKCRLSLSEVREILLKKSKDKLFAESILNNYSKRTILTNKDSVCTVCQNRLCVSEKGKVYPCEGWQNNEVGNINNSSLKKIWSSPKVKKLRNVCFEDFPKCVNCRDRYFCDICMLRNSNESKTGNPMEINEYFCSITHMLHDIIRPESNY